MQIQQILCIALRWQLLNREKFVILIITDNLTRCIYLPGNLCLQGSQKFFSRHSGFIRQVLYLHCNLVQLPKCEPRWQKLIQLPDIAEIVSHLINVICSALIFQGFQLFLRHREIKTNLFRTPLIKCQIHPKYRCPRLHHFRILLLSHSRFWLFDSCDEPLICQPFTGFHMNTAIRLIIKITS